jgi:RNA polymerase sigma-70 factor (ECF subfamily)
MVALIKEDHPSIRRVDSGSRDVQDGVLLQRLSNGDSEAFGELRDRYWGAIVTFAAKRVDSVDAAEDIAQETFVRLWQRREQWKPPLAVRSILYAISRNLMISQSRSFWTRRRNAVIESLPTSAPTPIELAEASEVRAAVERAIESLPSRRRLTFILARYHGLSYAEIAERMGVSPQTVANHMSAALHDLRRLLRPHLLPPRTTPND